ncbi:glycosyltransferase [Tenacibaculum dicentrarchi]|uniref:Teichuronic acid biosynthesis glycosyltransferase TuaG n=1 Tax=Tenacibaculum dicentrarchi TaxID=669041 RepID=A0ABM9NSK9_9FLAO|nr:glycosyltransferase [Tenacibaculum dicentrarchi]MCD8408193.1 glycosyltransferase [Tenacibaculum dicentrarchi]MCD8435718.1 glycosyltransferase [Tenacibaculum dicentrarchi]MCD8442841.1 glycosyltransferase [Tenacibaculum dicentrarchi]MCD8450257.1 glycosyltransferase [Tenacibaculum dicentrarchi]
MNNKVSIITPSYNSEKFISETIEGILNQSYTNWELLITDDGSTDKTIDIVKEYQKKTDRIKLFQLEENGGAGIARNNSIKNATGRFIAFCDSDDVWKSDKLEKQLSFMLKKDLSFTYCAYQKMDEKGVKGAEIFPPQKTTFNSLLKTCTIGCLTAIYDTDRLGKRYMPTIRKRQDYGLWLTIFKDIKHTEGIYDEVLAYYRVRSNSISSNKFKAASYHYKVLRECGEVSFIKSVYYFIYYSINGVVKYLK